MPATSPKRDKVRREVRDGEKERLVVRSDDTMKRAINRRGCFKRTGKVRVKKNVIRYKLDFWHIMLSFIYAGQRWGLRFRWDLRLGTRV